MNTTTLSFPAIGPEKANENLVAAVARRWPIENTIIFQRELVFTPHGDDFGSNNFHRELLKLDFLCKKAIQIIHREHGARGMVAASHALDVVSKIHAEVSEILGVINSTLQSV